MEVDTKTAILDAAEVLFVQQGFEGTSLRAVVAEAKVNIAAIHYHFGSKEALIQAVLTRRLDPINKERLKMLDQVEAESEGHPALEDILRALFEPAIRMSGCGTYGKTNIALLIGRVFSDPSKSLQSFLMDRFRIIFERFTFSLRGVLTTLPEADFFWRIHFMLGAMCHTLYDQDRPKLMSGGKCKSDDKDEVLEQLIGFVAGGLQAKTVDKVTKGEACRF